MATRNKPEIAIYLSRLSLNLKLYQCTLHESLGLCIHTYPITQRAWQYVYAPQFKALLKKTLTLSQPGIESQLPVF